MKKYRLIVGFVLLLMLILLGYIAHEPLRFAAGQEAEPAATTAPAVVPKRFWPCGLPLYGP